MNIVIKIITMLCFLFASIFFILFLTGCEEMMEARSRSCFPGTHIYTMDPIKMVTCRTPEGTLVIKPDLQYIPKKLWPKIKELDEKVREEEK